MNLLGKFAVMIATVIMSAIYVFAATHISPWLWASTILFGLGYFAVEYINELQHPYIHRKFSSTDPINILLYIVISIPFVNFFLIAVFVIMDYNWAQTDGFLKE